ncbi:DUF1449 family protein [Cytophagaceae bacterium ABcell3]|nr:DUF1449 family protein [Cytophagaceae bacterium ABcell3]
MLEIFSESLKPVNLPGTFILIIVLCYWIVNFLGLFDLEMFDTGDIESGKGGTDTGSGGMVSSAAEFFHFGDAPVTIVISFFALFFWAGSLLTNHYLHNEFMLIALLVYVPNIIVSLLLTKIFVKPVSKLYSKLKSQEAQVVDFSGSVCTVIIGSSEGRMGQGEINENGNSFRVNIRATAGNSLSRGDTALLIEVGENGVYLAEPYVETMQS